jgi:hypothetical protein
MGARTNVNKLLQEIRGFAELSKRRLHGRPIIPFSLQLRAHATRIRLPKLKLEIQTDLQDRTDIPHPVKITHLSNKPR